MSKFYTIEPNEILVSYKEACQKNNTKPVSDLELFKMLASGFSAIISNFSITQENTLSKFPIGEALWCLIFPVETGQTNIIFGPLDSINTLISKLTSQNENDFSISSIAQF